MLNVPYRFVPVSLFFALMWFDLSMFVCSWSLIKIHFYETPEIGIATRRHCLDSSDFYVFTGGHPSPQYNNASQQPQFNQGKC